MYEFNTSAPTSAVLRHYASTCRGGQRHRCRVEVLDWPLPALVRDRIWVRGQSLSLHDCLYRQMARTRYVVFGDVDEFLIPHAPGISDWMQLAGKFGAHPLSCAFQFQSAFFEPGRDPTRFVEGDVLPPRPGTGPPDLMTMRSIGRRKRFSARRTKCMVRPYEIFEAGIHHVSKPVWANLGVERVDPREAVIHHYRKCDTRYGGSPCNGSVTDDTALRYLDQLARATSEVWKELRDIL